MNEDNCKSHSVFSWTIKSTLYSFCITKQFFLFPLQWVFQSFTSFLSPLLHLHIHTHFTQRLSSGKSLYLLPSLPQTIRLAAVTSIPFSSLLLSILLNVANSALSLCLMLIPYSFIGRDCPLLSLHSSLLPQQQNFLTVYAFFFFSFSSVDIAMRPTSDQQDVSGRRNLS